MDSSYISTLVKNLTIVSSFSADHEQEEAADHSDDEDRHLVLDDDEDTFKSSKKARKKSRKTNGEAPSQQESKGNNRNSNKNKPNLQPGTVLYIGHLPVGMEETELTGFLRQFGPLQRIRVSRSQRTGKSRGYAFVQFHSADVAAIVADTLQGYLVMGEKRLVCHVIPDESISFGLFQVSKASTEALTRARQRSRAPAGVVEVSKQPLDKMQRITSRLRQRQAKKQAQLNKMGIDYDFGALMKEHSVSPSNKKRSNSVASIESDTKQKKKRNSTTSVDCTDSTTKKKKSSNSTSSVKCTVSEAKTIRSSSVVKRSSTSSIKKQLMSASGSVQKSNFSAKKKQQL